MAKEGSRKLSDIQFYNLRMGKMVEAGYQFVPLYRELQHGKP